MERKLKTYDPPAVVKGPQHANPGGPNEKYINVDFSDAES